MLAPTLAHQVGAGECSDTKLIRAGVEQILDNSG
jgi:hypothetical protein